MEVFSSVFTFLWDLLHFVSVDVGTSHFSLGGAIVFAVIVVLFIAFIKWLFSMGD